jgi:hypothetical protein
MTAWVYIQIVMLVGWLVAALIFYRVRAWKLSSPLSPYTGLILSVRFAVVAWLVSSILLGIVYLIITMARGKLLPVITLLVFPVTVIMTIAIRNYFITGEFKRRDDDIRTKTRAIKEWAHKFEFLNNEMIEIKLYVSNGSATGRLVITDVDQNEAEEINKHRNELPDQIHLVVLPKSQKMDNDNPIIYH